jgi:hypothetical protein
MNSDDAQTLRSVKYFVGELLNHVDVLPAGLASMLCDFASELRNSPPSRWDGIGDPADHGEKPDTVGNALHVLAVRGQLALETGSYYVLPAEMA